MAESPAVGVSKFFENIAPGGKYFRYSLAVLIALGLTVATLATMVILPLLTGRFQNAVSRRFLSQIGRTPSPTPSPVPTTCPNYDIPTGKQEFKFSHGEKVVGPKIQTAIIDPLDPAAGQRQTITLTVKHDSPVTSAAATLLTDNSDNQTVKFRLKSGSNTDGTWEASWQMKDSYKCRYAIKFDLKSSTGDYGDTMHIR